MKFQPPKSDERVEVVDVVDGRSNSPAEMVQDVVSRMHARGCEAAGVVVFGLERNGQAIHVFVGGPGWPEDIDNWIAFADALQKAVGAAQEFLTSSSSDRIKPEGRKAN